MALISAYSKIGHSEEKYVEFSKELSKVGDVCTMKIVDVRGKISHLTILIFLSLYSTERIFTTMECIVER